MLLSEIRHVRDGEEDAGAVVRVGEWFRAEMKVDRVNPAAPLRRVPSRELVRSRYVALLFSCELILQASSLLLLLLGSKGGLLLPALLLLDAVDQQGDQ